MKKIRILFLPLIIIALFSLNSCGPDEALDGFVSDSSNPDMENPENPATKGLFKADFNGATWTATNIEAFIYNNTITLIAKKANGESFVIGVVEGAIAGVYPTNTNEASYMPAGTDKEYLSVNEDDLTENTGSITISSINTSKKTISGTFNFKGYWEDNTKVPIFFTNGVFTDVPFVNTNPASGGGTTGGETTGGGASGGTVFLKKTIETDSKGGVITTNYTYNGNKIVSIIDDSGEGNTYFTYTGNLITKVEYKKSSNSPVYQIESYTYNANGKLATYVLTNPIDELGSKEVYTYNADGSISVKEYFGDDKTQTDLYSTGTIKFSNGEVSEITNSEAPTNKYLYDNKNEPFKNILGMDQLVFTGGFAVGNLHNTISEMEDGVVIYSTVYTYNSDSYPITSVQTGPSPTEKSTMQFFY